MLAFMHVDVDAGVALALRPENSACQDHMHAGPVPVPFKFFKFAALLRPNRVPSIYKIMKNLLSKSAPEAFHARCVRSMYRNRSKLACGATSRKAARVSRIAMQSYISVCLCYHVSCTRARWLSADGYEAQASNKLDGVNLTDLDQAE